MDLTRLVRPVRPAHQAAVRRWARHDLPERLWSGDPTVWSADPALPELSNRLGWLRLHERMRSELPGIERLASEVGDIDHVVLCGMGGSSLAPEVFEDVLGTGRPGLAVLDSTHPEAVVALLDRVEVGRSVFVISSKSGTTLETLSFFRTLWAASGSDGDRFVAVTDPGTPLEDLAHERGFRAVMTADPEVGGRFSALSHFGLVPAALCGIPLGPLLDSAERLAASEGEGGAGTRPGVSLGLALASLAACGQDKLTFLTSPSLHSLPGWFEQLLAESLGKEGSGVVPVADEPLGPPSVYGPDRAFLLLELEGEEGLDVGSLTTGFPAATIRVGEPADVAAEMLRAEVATAAAGEALGVHPFDQPDVESAKRLAREAMAGGAPGAGAPAETPGAGSSSLQEALDSLPPGGYFAVHAYLPPTEGTWRQITALRERVRERTGAATTAGWGPRFLHSTGQLHKGGPEGGLFLQLIDRPSRDVPVPETEHTFGQIVAAQASGDHGALTAAGRKVLRVDLGSDRGAGLDELLEGLG